MSWIENNEWLKPEKKLKIRWSEIARFLGNYYAFIGYLALAGLLALLASAALIFIPAVFRSIQDAITTSNSDALIWSLAAFLGIGLIEATATFFIGIISARISTRLNCNLLLEYYKRLLNSSVKEFIEFRQRTNLFQRIIDAMSVTPQFTEILVRGGQAVIIVCVVGVIIAMISHHVFVVLLIGSSLLGLFIYSQATALRSLRQKTLSFNYPLVGRMTEIIQGIFTIKSLSASLQVSSDVSALVERKRDAELRETARSVLSTQISQAIRIVTLTSAIGVSIFLLWENKILVADAIAIYVLANLFLYPISEIANLYQSLSSLSANIKNYYEVLDLPTETDGEHVREIANPKIPGSNNKNTRSFPKKGNASAIGEAQTASPKKSTEGHIVIKDLTFGYKSDKPVLKNINLEVLPGERISIIGKSGAGKTTLFRVLLGFLAPQSGSILIDGEDVATAADKAKLRKFFGVVSQSDFLFETSIRENLSFGLDEPPSDKRLEVVLNSVGLDTAISNLPEHIDSKYSEGSFSGGQRQRLLIARALLRDPSIVLLDEPTSALDFESEKMVISAINTLAGSRTMLTIAHRLSTIMCSDRVVVLRGGEIEASGPHAELYEKSQYYKELCDYNSFVV